MMLPCLILSLIVIAPACSREKVTDAASQVKDSTERAVENVQDRVSDIAVPVGSEPTSEQLERERFDQEWRQQQSFRGQVRQAQNLPAAPAAQVTFANDPKFQEKLEGARFENIDGTPMRVPVKGDVSGPSVLRAQVLLDRARFSVGVIDGRWGKNSEIAVYWFQRENGIQPTGEVDEATFRTLLQSGGALPTLTSYTVTAKDVEGPFVTIPEDVYEKEKLDCLCYESVGEKLAEQFHTTPELLGSLNGGRELSSLRAGDAINVPNVRQPTGDNANADLARIVISVKGWYLHGLGPDGSVLFHAPTTLGSEYDPSPNETLKVTGIAHNPHFHYQPKLFYEVDDTEPEANLKPGPNSPVGVVWMALSKPHYGIHGTAEPRTIGYTTSHGCVRLTNWDAHEVSHRIAKGIEVAFVDTKKEAPAAN